MAAKHFMIYYGQGTGTYIVTEPRPLSHYSLISNFIDAQNFCNDGHCLVSLLLKLSTQQKWHTKNHKN
jgi:hypothetical protein